MKKPALAARRALRSLVVTTFLLAIFGPATSGVRAQVEVLEIPVVAFEGDPVFTTGRAITLFQRPVVNNQDLVAAIAYSLGETPGSAIDVISWNADRSMNWHLTEFDGGNFLRAILTPRGAEIRWDTLPLAENGLIGGVVLMKDLEADFEGASFYSVVTAEPVFPLGGGFVGAEDYDVVLRDFLDAPPGREGNVVVKNLATPYPQRVLLNDAGTLAFMSAFGEPEFGKPLDGIDIYRKGPDDTAVVAAIMSEMGIAVNRSGEEEPATIAYKGFDDLAINDAGLLAFVGSTVEFADVPNPKEGPNEMVSRPVRHLVREEGEGAFVMVAEEGKTAPGFDPLAEMIFLSGDSINPVFFNPAFYNPSYNNKGEVAFLADLFANFEGTSTVSYLKINGNNLADQLTTDALYVGTNSEDLTLVILKGMLANRFFDVARTIGGEALEITNFIAPPLLNNQGQVLFIADVGNTVVGSVVGRGLLLYDPLLESESKTVAVADLREWTDDTETFEIFRVTEEYALDNSGNVAFKASIVTTTSGVTFDGLYYRPAGGALVKIVHVGDTVGVRGVNRKVTEIDFTGGSTASGRPVGITDNGGVVFGLSFDDETNGIFQIPSELPTLSFEYTGLYEPAPQNWHADVSNWKDNADGMEVSDVPGGGNLQTVKIPGFDVVLDERIVILKSIDSTGSLTVENELILSAASSSIENLSLGADLTLGGSLNLTGDSNFWTSGKIMGTGTLKNGGMLALGAPEVTLNLSATLETLDEGVTAFENGTLDLGTIGQILNLPGGRFDIGAASIVGDKSPSSSDSFRNQGTLVKSGAETGLIDVGFFENKGEGRILVEAGTLEFKGAGRFAGILETREGAETAVSLSDIVTGGLLGETLTIRGPGTVRMERGALQVGSGEDTIIEESGAIGGLVLGERMDLYGSGTLRVAPTGILRYASSETDEFDGSLIVDGIFEIQSGTFHLKKEFDAKGLFKVSGGDLILEGSPGTPTSFEPTHLEGAGFEVDADSSLEFGFGLVEVRETTYFEGEGQVTLGEDVVVKLVSGPSPASIISELRGTPLRLSGAEVNGLKESETAATPSLENRGNLVLNRGKISGVFIENDALGSLMKDPAPARLRIEPDSPGSIVFEDIDIFNAAPVGGFGGGVLEFAGTGIDFQGTLTNPGHVIIEDGAEVTIRNSPQVVALASVSSELSGGEWEIRNGTLGISASTGSLQTILPLSIVEKDAELRLIGPEADFNDIGNLSAKGSFGVRGRLRLEDHEFSGPENELGPIGVSGIVGYKSVSVVIDGVVELANGTIVLPLGQILWNRGHLSGVGTIDGTVFNSGEIDETIIISSFFGIGYSPGVFEITEDFINGVGGIVEIELGGLEAGNDYDRLIVGGTAKFLEESKITITLIDPNPGDEVDEIFIPRTDDVFSFLMAEDIEVPAGKTLSDFVEFTNLPDGVDLNLDLAVVDGMTVVTLVADSTLTPPPGPRIISHPSTQMADAGGPVTFSVGADSADAFTYQWQLNGVDIPDAADATYTVPFAQTTNSGDYSVVVTADGVSAASKIAALEVSAPPPNDARLLNLSTRAVSLTGNNVLIPGFVIEGTGTKNLLIRAVGASLRVDPFNIATALEDPQMTLKQWTGSAFEDVEANDDWETNTNAADIIQAMINLGAFALTDSRDAALLTDLDAGRYTVIAGGVGELTGVAIVELFDGDGETTTTVLKNISNRGFVGAGASIMIPGVTVSSEGPKTFLMRAVGPALGQEPFNLTGVLEDPKMTVFSGQTPILSNDNWGDSPDAANTAAVAALLGAFALPEGSKDAAMVVTLPPGGYTIQAAGVDGATGTAIVEVYVVE